MEVRVNCEQNSLLYLVRPRYLAQTSDLSFTTGCLQEYGEYGARQEIRGMPHKGARRIIAAVLLLSESHSCRTLFVHSCGHFGKKTLRAQSVWGGARR